MSCLLLPWPGTFLSTDWITTLTMTVSVLSSSWSCLLKPCGMSLQNVVWY